MLVTSTYLEQLVSRLSPAGGVQKPGPLVLQQVDSVSSQEKDSVTLNGVWMTAARPVFTTLIAATEGKDPLSRVQIQPGLWEVELADDRYQYYGRIVNKNINVREPAASCLYEETIFQDADNDPVHAWTYKEIITQLFSDVGLSAVNLATFDDTAVNPDSINPEDVIFNHIPFPVAVDRLLSEIGLAVFYDPTEEVDADRWKILKYDDRSQLDILMTGLRTKMETGGEGIVFPIVSANAYQSLHKTELSTGTAPPIPERKGTSASFFDFKTVAGVAAGNGTVVNTTRVIPTNKKVPRSSNAAQVGMADLVTEHARSRAEDMSLIEARYMGFRSEFLGTPGLTLVGYEWSLAPFTYIERKPLRPSGQLMKNRLAAQIRGEPTYAGVSSGASMHATVDESGWLHLEQAPMWFMGTVTKTYSTTNEGGTSAANADGCSVQPFEKDPAVGVAVTAITVDHVWCFEGSWIEVGDTVLCFYIGHSDRQWVAIGIPPVVTDTWCDPEDDCRLVGTTSCAPCDDTTEHPGQSLGDKKDEGTATVPTVGTCFGKPE